MMMMVALLVITFENFKHVTFLSHGQKPDMPGTCQDRGLSQILFQGKDTYYITFVV